MRWLRKQKRRLKAFFRPLADAAKYIHKRLTCKHEFQLQYIAWDGMMVLRCPHCDKEKEVSPW